jgi:hypothetical protein
MIQQYKSMDQKKHIKKSKDIEIMFFMTIQIHNACLDDEPSFPTRYHKRKMLRIFKVTVFLSPYELR